jgi:hypothetical protein
MSWGAQNRSKDAKTPSSSRGRSDKPEPDRCPVQPYISAYISAITQSSSCATTCLSDPPTSKSHGCRRESAISPPQSSCRAGVDQV